MKSKFWYLASAAGAFYLSTCFLFAQSNGSFLDRIQKVMSRPEFAHSHFGMEFYSLDRATTVFSLNADKLFVPGSTTKLLTEGTALELLGGDYRFHTRVFRTGSIDKDGTLDGDLILVASGDPNLSNRIQPDGTLAFEDEDHAYGGPDSKGLPGDPLLVMREFADQIAQKGIHRINGRLLVDSTLFPEGERDPGTGVVISPIVVNDNLVDVIASPGASAGAPILLQISPKTAYVSFTNQATTGEAATSGAGFRPEFRYTDKLNPDGTHSVIVTGSLPLQSRPQMRAYRVPEPSRYAATVWMEALGEKGITANLDAAGDKPDFKSLAANYKPENLVAEHVSPPLKEEVKVTLKVSQNLHASMTPFVLGAVLAHQNQHSDQAGFDLEHDFLKRAELDLTAASQSDGAGGNAFFTPDFMMRYLLFMSRQKDFSDFYRSLPILGRDGTLVQIQVNSPAAGHVHAKTGTFAVYDALNKNMMVTGKGLAGYMETASGQHLVLAVYVNLVAVSREDPDATQKVAGEALGEIAAAAYDSALPH